MSTKCIYADCEKSAYAKALCAGHYQQKRAGRPLKPLRKRVTGGVLDRLKSKVAVGQQEDRNSCWDWLGHVTSEGYGQISVEGSARLAHREMYSRVTGRDIGSAQIDHICHNRKCVNPEHLRKATGKQNGENRSGANKNSKSGVRGVYLTAKGRYRVMVRHNYKAYGGGTFATLEEAEAVAIALRNRLFTYNVEL